MSKSKEPTLFYVKLLKDTAYNYAGDVLAVKTVDEDDNIYYYDSFHRWCYLPNDGEWWIRIDKKPSKIRAGRWIFPNEEMPEITDQSEPETSNVVLIKSCDGCIWLAFWDGTMWINATDSSVTMKKDYVVKWMKIPR